MATAPSAKRTILDRDPAATRLFRAARAVVTAQANPVQLLRDWWRKRRLLQRLRLIDRQTTYRSDPEYQRYITAQQGHLRSVHALFPDVSWKHELALPKIAAYFAEQQVALDGLSVLCVGCRTGAELTAFEALGVGHVTGIDLYSIDPARVRLMDMHAMTFADESFDVVFSADSLEHSFDVQVALAQMLRVARRRSLLCVMSPVGFEPNPRHPTDLRSIEHLIGLVGPAYRRTVHHEMRASKRGQPYMVAILEINKGRMPTDTDR